ncbi:hypothetical protein [Citromicrobium bathyomarinum]|uniref:hypothetical protein n=1 Tax=Citromicrobium bathyomarinum TaxID=72174 RepID=UPI001E2B93B7|nr:hypothetical protein [Citromicrobium bathyomarinum]MCD1621275.1 hypothetical protein [Citromicrobium bathyomarinum]
MIPYLTTDHVSAFGDLGVALAALFAAWQGVKSLNAWRAERLGGRKIELAEDGLTQFYKIEHAFQAIRSPFGDASESADRDVEDHESPAERHGRDLGQATWKRLQAKQVTFEDFYVLGLQLKAHFGEEIYEECQAMRRCFARIRTAAQMMYSTPYEGYEDKNFRRRLEADIWNMDSDDPDSIEMKVQNAVKVAERILGKELR